MPASRERMFEVLTANRHNQYLMIEQCVRHLDAAAAQMPDGTIEMDCIPARDDCGEQSQA